MHYRSLYKWPKSHSATTTKMGDQGDHFLHQVMREMWSACLELVASDVLCLEFTPRSVSMDTTYGGPQGSQKL